MENVPAGEGGGNGNGQPGPGILREDQVQMAVSMHYMRELYSPEKQGLRRHSQNELDAFERDVTHGVLATDEAKRNKSLVMLLLQDHPDFAIRIMYLISDELKGDREVVTEAVSKQGDSLMNASEDLRDDPDLVRLAFQVGGVVGEALDFMNFVGYRALDNRVAMLAAMHSNLLNFGCASCELQMDVDMLVTALGSNDECKEDNWYEHKTFELLHEYLFLLNDRLMSQGEMVLDRLVMDPVDYDGLVVDLHSWIKPTYEVLFLLKHLLDNSTGNVTELKGVDRRIIEYTGLSLKVKDYAALTKYEPVIRKVVQLRFTIPDDW